MCNIICSLSGFSDGKTNVPYDVIVNVSKENEFLFPVVVHSNRILDIFNWQRNVPLFRSVKTYHRYAASSCEH